LRAQAARSAQTARRARHPKDDAIMRGNSQPPPLPVILGMLAVSAGFIAYAVFKTRRLIAAWREFAQRNGFELQEKTGPWYARNGPMMTGVVDGVTLVLERHISRRGRSSSEFTRVQTVLDRPLDSKLIVQTRTWSSRIQYQTRPPIIETGSTSFDERMIVRCESRQDVLDLIDSDVSAQLLAFPRRVEIRGESVWISVSWRGAERDPAVLEAGCKLIVALSRSRATSAPGYVQAPGRGA
jgi:hypothetical protein